MKYNVITIERQYASGGRAVGQLVAERLGIPFYNREILEMAARKIGFPADYLEHAEETSTNSLLFGLYVSSSYQTGNPSVPLSEQIYCEEEKIIRDLAAQGPCVIVGRCASFVLRERKDCLRTFLYAEQAARIARAQTVYGETGDIAASLKKHDKRRAGFYSANAEQKWNDMREYDLCLSTSALGIEKCAQLIVDTAK